MCTISPLINLSLSSPLNKSVCLHHSGGQGLLLHLCTFWFVSWWLAPFLYLCAGWGFLFLISCVFWGKALGNSLCASLFVIHLSLFFSVIILFQSIVNPCLYLRKYCVFFLFVFFSPILILCEATCKGVLVNHLCESWNILGPFLCVFFFLTLWQWRCVLWWKWFTLFFVHFKFPIFPKLGISWFLSTHILNFS